MKHILVNAYPELYEMVQFERVCSNSFPDIQMCSPVMQVRTPCKQSTRMNLLKTMWRLGSCDLHKAGHNLRRLTNLGESDKPGMLKNMIRWKYTKIYQCKKNCFEENAWRWNAIKTELGIQTHKILQGR